MSDKTSPGIKVLLATTLTEAAAIGWDEAVASLRYEDGTPVEIVKVVNPYRAPEGTPT